MRNSKAPSVYPLSKEANFPGSRIEQCSKEVGGEFSITRSGQDHLHNQNLVHLKPLLSLHLLPHLYLSLVYPYGKHADFLAHTAYSSYIFAKNYGTVSVN